MEYCTRNVHPIRHSFQQHPRGGDAAGDAPGFDPNDTMTSLGRQGRYGFNIRIHEGEVCCQMGFVFETCTLLCVCFATSLDVTQVITAYIHLKHI